MPRSYHKIQAIQNTAIIHASPHTTDSIVVTSIKNNLERTQKSQQNVYKLPQRVEELKANINNQWNLKKTEIN